MTRTLDMSAHDPSECAADPNGPTARQRPRVLYVAFRQQTLGRTGVAAEWGEPSLQFRISVNRHGDVRRDVRRDARPQHRPVVSRSAFELVAEVARACFWRRDIFMRYYWGIVLISLGIVA